MNLLQAIGRTPLVELMNTGARPGARILCKLEGCNPGGSVKDRPALSMIAGAERRGDLAPGKTILEPTSGNTGIAIAMIGAAKGYAVHLCMPECVSAERSMILQGLGADVSLTPAREGIDGAIHEAHALLEREPERYYMPQPVREPGQHPGSSGDHGAGDLGADGRRGRLLRCRHGHHRHAHGHRPISQVGQA
jgi:S-sulfo-L-cysteine synthase (O-acetyl-L-serine-dependent)